MLVLTVGWQVVVEREEGDKQAACAGVSKRRVGGEYLAREVECRGAVPTPLPHRHHCCPGTTAALTPLLCLHHCCTNTTAVLTPLTPLLQGNYSRQFDAAMAAELALPWPAVLGHDQVATGSFSVRTVVALDADGAG